MDTISKNGRVTPGKEDLLEKILTGKKTLVAYYTEKTGTVGDSYIAEDEPGIPNHWNEGFEADPRVSKVVNCVDLLVNKAVAHKTTKERGYLRRGGKVAAEYLIEGIDTPVFFAIFDSGRIICTEIRERGTKVQLN